MSKKPILGITMGDPASIGPEITVKALSDPAIYEKCSPIIIGDAAVMEAAVGIVGKMSRSMLYPMSKKQNLNSVPLMFMI